VLGGVLLGACSGSGYHYVKSSEDRTYFKVPDEWKLYDEDQVLATLGKSLSPRQREVQLETAWHVAFDAADKPALNRHFLDPRARKPVGLASVEELDFDTSDQLSIQSLRNFYFEIDAALDNGSADVQLYEPLEVDGGFHGIHLIADIEDAQGRVLTFDQTSLLDQSTSKLYTLLVACSADCYEEHQDKIDRVVDSWTVED
jgi:hypothetical protein